MSEQERIAVFIDGSNLYAATRNLEFDIDYRKMLAEMKSWGRLLRVFYYTAVVEDDEYHSIRPLLDWLDYNGFSVVTKNAKTYTDDTGRRKIKGNMDIELAVDALETAPHIDHAYIFSGDGDFTRVVQAVQRKGVRVSVVSSLTTRPPMIADELRRQCDEFIELTHLVDKIGRDPEVRAERMRKRAEAQAEADNE
ncbi:NYN domain-containing protein [Rhizobiales bacterium TNE-4]|nr:NYN domain-containing protein [Rhizobiales bacterium TNE-4]MBV1828996.1 NYN domain-containing protein [Rhizobiales bacterium TNE-4]